MSFSITIEGSDKVRCKDFNGPCKEITVPAEAGCGGTTLSVGVEVPLGRR